MVDYYNTRSSTVIPSSGVGPTAAQLRTTTAKSRSQRDKSTLHKTLADGGVGSGGSGGGVTGSQQPRIRIVRLVRPHQSTTATHHRSTGGGGGGGNFGFSIRGGLEYGTGFFVSAIERDSEADRQGLKVGDQIVRVNGYQVEDAVHRELASFIANQERLIMKVRALGILPIKERSVDPLTWHLVSSARDTEDTLLLLEDGPCCGRDLKVILSVAPRTKLGCGICKGPDWKPGIFVQFTKEGGVAREAGLRPGDQILSCNGHSFAEASFSEAVSVMKSSHVLELIVRPSAGLDLFPGESSGYNSSASSVNGDQSPCWGDQTSKRLSIVREESISHERRRTAAIGELKPTVERPSTGSVSTPTPPPQTSPPAQTVATSGGGGHRRKNTTIIEFSERGTIVNPDAKQSETKTIIVEVHRSASTGSIGGAGSNTLIPPPPPPFADSVAPPPPPPQGLVLAEPTAADQPGTAKEPAESAAPANSLCSAISDELRRRAEKKSASAVGGGAPDGAMASALAGPAAALTELENRLKEKNCRLRPVTMAISDERHTALMDEFRAVHKRMFKNGFDNAELKRQPVKGDKGQPSAGLLGAAAPAEAALSGTRKSAKGTMGRVAASEMAKASGDSAELESLESFKLTNPQAPPARPPSYYFCPQATGPATMKKSQKPIAVTISEYASSSASRGAPDEPVAVRKPARFVQLRPVTADGATSGINNEAARSELRGSKA
ncbi:uncharacterized protein LOC131209202 [Anopheles bellator]|uniref:uncharacterized protein LOC131209202 n=1 Tax=Anopheles bellator TaxID=139047 RepID=UPI00264823EE|nr:uncharacterized protein LOC131209202 [Anopheles bellator]